MTVLEILINRSASALYKIESAQPQLYNLSKEKLKDIFRSILEKIDLKKENELLTQMISDSIQTREVSTWIASEVITLSIKMQEQDKHNLLLKILKIVSSGFQFKDKILILEKLVNSTQNQATLNSINDIVVELISEYSVDQTNITKLIEIKKQIAGSLTKSIT